MPTYLGQTRIIDCRYGSTSTRRALFNGGIAFARSPTNQDMLDAISLADTLEAALVAGTVPANVLAGSKSAYLTKRDANTYLGYSHLGGVYWAEYQFSTGAIANGPYSWNQTRLLPMYGYVLANDAGNTYAVNWDGTYLTTQNPALYIGGKARQSQSGASTLSITFTGGGDVWCVFVGRTSGGYVRVQIDGANPVAGSGNSLFALNTGVGFDTYTAVDLTAKQFIKLATGLSNASHTILFTVVTTQKNASSSGNRFIFNALAISSTTRGVPDDTTRDAATWVTATAYVQFQQVQYQGNYYSSSTASATSGATPPTHTTGTVSDGAVSWLFMASTSYSQVDQIIQAAGSQLEYAYQIKPSGQSTNEDVGGIVHGNEVLGSVKGQVAGVDTALTTDAYISGADVELVQAITGNHSIGGNTTTTVLTHKIESNKVSVSYSHTWLQVASIGWFYAAMWPLLQWHATKAKYCLTTLQSPEHGSTLVSGYYGVSNPIIDKLPELLLAGYGNVFMPDGASGVASLVAATHLCRVWLRMGRTSVNDYANDYDVRAGKAMNISGTTAPGFSSVVPKLYFGRADATVQTAVAINDVWTASNVYNITLEAL